MTEKISPKDLKLLSTYLDQELRPREKKGLESRLIKSQELRRELESLRHTRQLLRAAPRHPAPRSFTLTPNMVPALPQSQLLFSVSRLAFGLASLLFAITFAGNFLFGSPAANQLAAPSLAMDSAQESESMPVEEAMEIQAEKTGDTAPPEPGLEEGEIALEPEEPLPESDQPLGSGSDDGEATARSADDLESPDEVPMEALTQSPTQMLLVEEEDPGSEDGADSGDTPPDIESAEAPSGSEPSLEPSPTAQSEPEAEIISSEPAISYADEGTPPRRTNIWQLSSIFFGLLALLSGVVYWVLRRQG